MEQLDLPSYLFFIVLTYNDEQFHQLERIKVNETFKNIEGLLSNDCIPAILHAADALADWYK